MKRFDENRDGSEKIENPRRGQAVTDIQKFAHTIASAEPQASEHNKPKNNFQRPIDATAMIGHFKILHGSDKKEKENESSNTTVLVLLHLFYKGTMPDPSQKRLP